MAKQNIRACTGVVKNIFFLHFQSVTSKHDLKLVFHKQEQYKTMKDFRQYKLNTN